MATNKVLRSLLPLAAAALLAACGGGGGDSGPPPPYGYSAEFRGICTLEGQKKFVRAYLDEVYLWYDEIVDVDPAQYSTVPDYFNALLVKTPDANGLPKDRFSAVITSGSPSAPSPSEPQADAGLLKSHSALVPIHTTFTAADGRTVGYIKFDDHAAGAQDALITAFREIQPQGVRELVLDLRDNSGGFLYVAQTAASMIVGPQSEGLVFERLRYNAKRAAETAASSLLFSSKVQFEDTTGQYPVGTALPQLSLQRVFVLTTGRTCSASESIVNALRGIGVDVIRVGSTTCGKPYGFRETQNCGYSFYPIEFQGTNAVGFGDYTTGFAPVCQVAENRNVPAGSSTDPLLNGARHYIDNDACPPGSATGLQSAGTPLLTRAPAEQPTRPAWAGRLLLPQQQPR